jgi:hypothetical protein
VSEKAEDHSLDTGGGSAVSGDVETGGGSFTGRDHRDAHSDAQNDAHSNIKISLENNELGRQNNEYLQSIDQRLIRMEQNIDFRFYRLEDKTDARLVKIENEIIRLKDDVVIVKLPSRPPQIIQNGNFRLVFILLSVISFVLILILIYIARGA